VKGLWKKTRISQKIFHYPVEGEMNNTDRMNFVVVALKER
jgi:hypothetical protein